MRVPVRPWPSAHGSNGSSSSQSFLWLTKASQGQESWKYLSSTLPSLISYSTPLRLAFTLPETHRSDACIGVSALVPSAFNGLLCLLRTWLSHSYLPNIYPMWTFFCLSQNLQIYSPFFLYFFVFSSTMAYATNYSLLYCWFPQWNASSMKAMTIICLLSCRNLSSCSSDLSTHWTHLINICRMNEIIIMPLKK